MANISSKSYSNYTFLNRFTSNNQTVCESVLFDPILHQWLLLPFWVSRYRKGKGFPILRRRNGKKGCHGPIQEIQQKENDPGYDLLAGVRHQIFFLVYDENRQLIPLTYILVLLGYLNFYYIM